MMKRYLFLYVFLVLLLGVSACGNEDDLVPTGEGARVLSIPDKSGRFNELAYEIYTNTGMPIFVNDTLMEEQRGVDYEGNPIIHYEMFVIGYSIFSQTKPASIVLSSDTTAMVKAAGLIRDKVIPRFMPQYKPFCILMADSLYSIYRAWTANRGFLAYGTPEYAHKDMMGVVVGYLSDISNMSEDEQEMWAGRILGTQIVEEIQSRYTDELNEFYNLSLKSGKATWHDAVMYAKLDGTPITVGYDVDFRNVGFLEWIWNGKFSATQLVRKYPSTKIDVIGYIAAVYAFDEAKFNEMYKDYPLCVEKYKLMKAIVAKFESEVGK